MLTALKAFLRFDFMAVGNPPTNCGLVFELLNLATFEAHTCQTITALMKVAGPKHQTFFATYQILSTLFRPDVILCLAANLQIFALHWQGILRTIGTRTPAVLVSD